MTSVKELLNKVQEVLVKQTNPLAIILFGSYSRNTQNVDSDIDIAIKAEKLDRKMLFNLKQELEEITSKDIDLIDLDDISDSFRYEILMNGKLLYCADSYKFDMYKIDMMREYFELNESRKDIIKRIKEGVTIYGK